MVHRAGAGEAVADGGVDQDVERVRDERAGVGGAASAGGQLGPGGRGHRRGQRLGRGQVDALHDGPPAGTGAAGAGRIQRREDVAPPGEVVGEGDHGAQVRDGGAVAQLVGRVVELGGIDGDGRHRPGPQLEDAARRGARCGAHELGEGAGRRCGPAAAG